MPIMAITAGIGAGGSILSGLLGGKAAKNAAGVLNAQGQASAGAVNGATTAGQGLIAGQQNNLNGIYAPLNANLGTYLNAGQTGINNLQSAIAPGGSLSQQFSFDPSQIYSNPAYQFNLQQGMQGIQRSAAATGGALGAGTQKSLAQFASGLAANQYNTAYNQALTSFQTNRQNTMQNLSTLLGVGQFGTQQANQLGTTLGSQGNQLALGSAQLGLQGTEAAQGFAMQGAGANAAGIVGSTNAYNSILPGISNAIGGYGLSQMYGGGGFGGYGSMSAGGGFGGAPAWPTGSTSYNTATGQYTYGGDASQNVPGGGG